MHFHAQSIAQAFTSLQVTRKGLTKQEAEKRLKVNGKNELPTSGNGIGRFTIFINQWKSPLLLLLLTAGIVSGILGAYLDMTIILITVFVNSVVGFFQEDKANQALKKLNTLIRYPAFVLRDNQKQEIDSSLLVPGDIMFLNPGDKVQADGRIIEMADFEVDESTLTGESVPVRKSEKRLSKKLATFDRVNIVYRGTIVLNGRATVLVTSTGEKTEIGQVATLVKETVDERTPLQDELEGLGKTIGIIVVIISIAIFVIGLLIPNGHSVLELFETAVAVAVAAIPEGMAISLTVILAIGMQYILKRGALVRKLVAAETLGSVSVICTDKTGTLTEGNMQVTRLVTANSDVDFEGLKKISIDKKDKHEDLLMAVRVGVYCNDAVLQNPDDNTIDWKFLGDTTDIPLVRLGMHVGIEKHHLDQATPRVSEIPFDSEKKYMATLQYEGDEGLMYVKGASDILLSDCSFYLNNGKVSKLSKKQFDVFKKKEDELTNSGLRVLALAYKSVDVKKKVLKVADVTELVFVGFVALSDPVRPDVAETLKIARGAGIKIVMITGDHVSTARAIAKGLGFKIGKGKVFDGENLEKITDEELQEVVKNATVFARVDPKHKIRIVKAYQANGEIVAMTGDGVNDAPALKGADIGVALGSGTDVAKETSDIVLTNNAVSTIVAAVEEGRGIYQNIKKVVLYLLSGSFAEVVMVMGSIIAGLPVAALPAQILWVNIIEDTFPTMALAFDKGDKENMKDRPRKKGLSIIDREIKTMIILKSVLSNVLLFSIFVWFWFSTGDIKLTRTIVFVGFAIDALFYIFSIRSLRKMIWRINIFSNLYLIAAVLFGWGMLLLAIYWYPLQVLLRTVPLNIEHWILMISFGMFNLVLIEVVKWVFIMKRKKA